MRLKRRKKTILLTLKEAQSQVGEKNLYVNKYINYHKIPTINKNKII